MLNRFQFLALVTALAVAEVNGSAFRTVASADEKAKAVETTEVKLMDLTLKLPKSWKALPNTSTMRLATYEIPKADGDPEAGELSVFSFAGGGGPSLNLFLMLFCSFSGSFCVNLLILPSSSDPIEL